MPTPERDGSSGRPRGSEVADSDVPPPAPPSRPSRRAVMGGLAGLPALVVGAGTTRAGAQDDATTSIETTAASTAAGAGTSGGRVGSTTTAPESVRVRPRSAWTDEPPTQPLRSTDDRLLVIHHTESTNEYEPGDVAALIAGVRAFHVDELGWPDIGFNFVVDRFGRTWEGRVGSLRGPVACELEGGDPGHTQHCAFLGSFGATPPNPLAVESMVSLLAMLANRDGVVTEPGTTTDFLSEGSDLFPSGTQVSVRTIAAHSDLSDTACPGEATFTEVVGRLQSLVSGERTRLGPVGLPDEVATTVYAGTTLPPATTLDPGDGFVPPPATRRDVGFEASPLDVGRNDDAAVGVGPALVAGGIVVAGVGAAGASWLRHRRSSEPIELPATAEISVALSGGVEARALAERRTIGDARSIVLRPAGNDLGSAGWIPTGETSAIGWLLAGEWPDDHHDAAIRELRTLARRLVDAPDPEAGRAFGEVAAETLIRLGHGGENRVGKPDGPGALAFRQAAASTSVLRIGACGFALPGEDEHPVWMELQPTASNVAVLLGRRWRHPSRLPAAVGWLGSPDDEMVLGRLATLPDRASTSELGGDEAEMLTEAMRDSGVELGMVVA